jgi:hypothetical protein
VYRRASASSSSASASGKCARSAMPRRLPPAASRETAPGRRARGEISTRGSNASPPGRRFRSIDDRPLQEDNRVHETPPDPHDDTMATASHPSAPNRVSPAAASAFGFFMSKDMYSHRCIASLYLGRRTRM